jgi:peptidyl-prolyl cis-trans isomerase D
MLDLIRKNASSWVIKVMLFIVALVFVFFGVGGYATRDANTILKIDNVRVPYSEYRDMYNNLYQALAEVTDRVDSELLASLDLEGQALEALKDRYLLMAAAEEMKIEVTGEEISNAIVSSELFLDNGFFSSHLYQAFLDMNQMTDEKYKSVVAADLAIKKVTSLITAAAGVTPQEVDEDLELLTTLAAVKVLVLSPNLFIREVGTAGDDELADYFEENEELFRVPERFEQDVVIIDPLDYVGDVSVPEEDVQDWYDDNEEEFMVPPAYTLSHILFAFPEDATAAQISDIRTLAEDTLEQVNEGGLTFSAAARKYSDDKSTAGKGGDLGQLEESAIENSLLKAIGNLEPGEVSDPIPTSRGFEIVKLGDVREERLQELDEVKDDIEAAIRLELARELALDTADDILDAVEDVTGGLRDTAGGKGLTVFESGVFTRDRYAGAAANLPMELINSAFMSEEGEVSDVVIQDERLYIGQTSRRDESQIPELDEVREQVEGSWLIREALLIAEERGREMVAALKDGHELTTLSRQVGSPMILTPEPFTILEDSVPNIDDGADVVSDAFTLTGPGDAVLTSGSQAHYVVVLEELLTATEEELAIARPQVEEALREQREKEVLEGYLTALREEYKEKIWVNNDLI